MAVDTVEEEDEEEIEEEEEEEEKGEEEEQEEDEEEGVRIPPLSPLPPTHPLRIICCLHSTLFIPTEFTS